MLPQFTAADTLVLPLTAYVPDVAQPESVSMIRIYNRSTRKIRSYQHLGTQTGGENKSGDLGPSPSVGKDLFEKRCAQKDQQSNSLVNVAYIFDSCGVGLVSNKEIQCFEDYTSLACFISQKYWPHFTARRHVFCGRKVVSQVDRMKVVYQMKTYPYAPTRPEREILWVLVSPSDLRSKPICVGLTDEVRICLCRQRATEPPGMHPNVPRSAVNNHCYFHQSVYFAPVGRTRRCKMKVEVTGLNLA